MYNWFYECMIPANYGGLCLGEWDGGYLRGDRGETRGRPAGVAGDYSSQRALMLLQVASCVAGLPARIPRRIPASKPQLPVSSYHWES